MLQVTDELIRNVVQQVLTNMKVSPAPSSAPAGRSETAGVFDNVNDAVAAAAKAQKRLESLGLDGRKKATDCIRKICIEKAEMLGLEEFEETKIGRLKHKVEKLVTAGERSPGVEFLRTAAFGSMNNLTLEEYAPFGIVGIITPVTHSLPTMANNASATKSIFRLRSSNIVDVEPAGKTAHCNAAWLA